MERKTDVQESDIQQVLARMYGEVFSENAFVDKTPKMLLDDKKLIRILESDTQLVKVHYQFPLRTHNYN